MANEITWRLEHERIGRLLLHYAMPAVIGTMVNALYNIVDRIFIGQGVGPLAMAGLTLTFPILLFLQAFGMLIGAGAATRVSIYLGRRENEMAEKVLGNAFTLTFIITLATVVPCMIWMKDLLLAFGGSEQIIPYAQDYLNIVVPGTLLTSLSFGFNAVMRASGYPKKAMFTMLIGAITNVILDPIFIFWFDMGVKGAALATVLSQACSAAWVLSFLFSRRASLPLEKRNMRLSRKIVFAMLALGISPFIMASTESLVGFVLNSSLKNFGDIYVSALTILQSAMQFASVPLTGFALGFVPIISYNYGHGDKQRVKDCFRIVMITMFSFNLLLMLLMILFPTIVASAFTSDEKLIETVRWTMPVFLGGMTIFGLQRACQNMFVALGQAKISIFIALLRKAILLIPLALILPHYMGVTGVYAAEAISDATAAICCTLLFFWQFPKILGKIQGNILRTD